MEIISRKQAKKLGLKCYFTGIPCKKGHVCERTVDRSWCIECQSFYLKERYKNNKEEILKQQKQRADILKEQKRIAADLYYQENKDLILKQQENKKILDRQKNRERLRQYRENYIWVCMWVEAKKRARKKALPFDITSEDIKEIMPIDMVCPVLGIKMEVGVGRPRDNSPSIDRIDPKLGYIKGNIAVMSHKANTIKSNEIDPEIFYKVGKWLEINLPKKTISVLYAATQLINKKYVVKTFRIVTAGNINSCVI